ncbi:MAG TPA: glycoside hydrolase family 3 N-terminal domain-containing protein [Ilumatobacteraceae bacterium]|nr:glycoside hydrolase family 3 N-terminal domain-containing protein [Ilumatobacteraceae bacterium]
MSAAGDRRLAAACLLGSFVGTEPPPWLLRAVRDGLGGVLLFAQNVVDDAQVAQLCAQLRDARADVVIAIDEEGGDVTRLDAAGGSDTPCPIAFGFVDDVSLTADAYASLGSRVRSLGIDLTLAPVADINSNPRNPIIGVRSFGTTPDVVARHVVAAIDGFHHGGISVCAKHYPGHGDTSDDTHLGGARLSASMDTLNQRELVPFAASIEAGVDAILTAHLVADALDDAPVSISSAWTSHLRDAMGFDGVVITDALDMEALAEGRGIEGIADAAVRALQAGADFLCLGSNFDEAMTNTVVDRVASALDDARLQRTHIDRSRRRIAMLHRPAPTPAVASSTSDSGAAEIVAERAITVDGHLPDGPFAVVECRPPGTMACFNVSWGIAKSLRERGWRATTITAADPVEPACATAVDAAGDMPILVVVRDACVHTWQSSVVDALVAARPDSVVVIELGWPGPRPSGVVAHVITHGAARSSARAAIDRLGTPNLVREP